MLILHAEHPTTGHQAFPKAIFMVLPEKFSLAADSATDNTYMAPGHADPALALAQSLALSAALKTAGNRVVLFPGDGSTPDAVFPNNAFATIELHSVHSQHTDSARGGYCTGVMRHPIRQLETKRRDLVDFFAHVLGYQHIDFAADLTPGDTAELTGSLVIDRARNIGFCGLSQRCSMAGARAMHRAFGLNKTYIFELAAGEYHTNVILSALGGKGLVICPAGFADAADAHVISALYPARCVILSDEEKNHFAANCIALNANQLWMSARAKNALRPANLAAVAALGFQIHAVELSELEKAGGSLRCMLGEIY
jgi:hypothetical protein